MKPRYVQHVSKQGKKWKLAGGAYNTELQHPDWRVEACGIPDFHYLPKSEYIFVDSPKEWRHVPVDFVADCRGIEIGGGFGPRILLPDGYRFRTDSLVGVEKLVDVSA